MFPAQSRWGFHPCDYPTFRKLKFLNLVYLRAIRMAHAWKRWHRKDPQNRVRRRCIRNDKGQRIGYADPVPITEPVICPLFSRKIQDKVVTDDPGISADYAVARKPVSEPGAVQPLRMTVAEIEALYERARAWLEGQDLR